MPLLKCPECGNMISDAASACPKCGMPMDEAAHGKIAQKAAEAKKTGQQVGVGCLVVLLLFVGLCIADNNDEDSSPKTPQEAREEMLEKHFSAWDGSHNGVTAYIKKHMNDPSSYEHVETRYGDRGDHLVVQTTFRGKNAFGGKIINKCQAKVDLKGSILEVLYMGP